MKMQEILVSPFRSVKTHVGAVFNRYNPEYRNIFGQNAIEAEEKILQVGNVGVGIKMHVKVFGMHSCIGPAAAQ